MPQNDLQPLKNLSLQLLGLSSDASHAAERFIPLTVKNRDGERQIWPAGLQPNGNPYRTQDSPIMSRLLIAPSGAGKTTLLKEIALDSMRAGNALLAFYLHLGWLADKTPGDYLVERLNSMQGANNIIKKLENDRRLIYLLDGFDQVDGQTLAQRIHEWAPSCVKVIASRPLPDAVLSDWEDRGWSVWTLVPVGPPQARQYLQEKEKVELYSRLTMGRAMRPLLRLPLYLRMLRAADFAHPGPRNGASFFDAYWRWRTMQENKVRREAGREPISDSVWAEIRNHARECAWRLAVDGHIQEFETLTLPDQISRPVSDLASILQAHNLQSLDIVSADVKGGKFGHQAFQAHLAVEAMVVDAVKNSRQVATSAEDEGPVLSTVLGNLQTKFPERLELDSLPSNELSFWMEAIDILPGALYRLVPDTERRNELFSFLIRSLADHGLFLLGWRLVRAAIPVENGGVDSWGGWPTVLWQLVRYRRDAEEHFPDDAPDWAYDPLPLAVRTLDTMRQSELDALRNGLRHALEKISGPRTQKLGLYELMASYMAWDGTADNLDRHRIGFLLGDQDACDTLAELSQAFLNGGHPRVQRSLGVGVVGSLAASSDLPKPDTGKFGEWLRGKANATHPDTEVLCELEQFEEAGFATDSVPTTREFCLWIGRCYLDDLLDGKNVPLDVSLSMFVHDWTWGIEESVRKRLNLTKQEVLKRLRSEKLEDQMAASVVLGPMTAASKAQETLTSDFADPVYELFLTSIRKSDVELAYTAYHEASRFVTNTQKVRTMQDHIKRYYAQEIRWHDVYWGGGSRQIDYEWQRMIGERPYPNKTWFYCFDAPLLAELGKSPDGRDVDRLLSDYEEYAQMLHEQEALDWAKNAVACMRTL